MTKAGRKSADASRPLQGRKRSAGEASLLEGLLDERQRVPLDDFRRRFVQEEGGGLRYALFHYLVAERYRALRENSKRKFIEGLKHSHWPVPPQHLSTSYMAMPAREGADGGVKTSNGTASANPSADASAVPLHCLLQPRGHETVSTSISSEDTIDMLRHGLLEESVRRETRAPPDPGVTMDQSYALHVVLAETTEKVWPACMEQWRRVYKERREPREQITTQGMGSLTPVTPTLDPFLKRAVAEQAQSALSGTFDWCLDLLQWPVEETNKWPQYSMDARNVLMAAERANVPSWILDRVKARLRRLFPSMPLVD